MSRARIACLLVGALSSIGCGVSTTPSEVPISEATITVTDLAGREVTLKQPIERIVLIRGRDIYELALLLGEEMRGKLVAWGPDLKAYDRDGYEMFVEAYPWLADVPNIGSIYRDATSVEQILDLNPDLVIVENFMRERSHDSIDRMERAGIPLLFLETANDPLVDPQRSLALLGRILDREDRSREINEFIEARLQEVYSKLDDIEEPSPSVYLEQGARGVATFGWTWTYDSQRRLSCWAAIVGRLPSRNIAVGVVPNLTPVHPEYLLAKDPQLIIFTGANWPTFPDTIRLGYTADPTDARSRLRAYLGRPGWRDLQSVRSGRVHAIFHGFCMHAFNFVALQQLAKWLYPATFADLAPRERLDEFHRRFLPYACQGTWMISLEDKG
ncbi:Periplasmic binding protein [Planctomycetes bacterium Pan216]|uniref:Periplasmic binding protein n=1 Tax=Kolteria novifilia TaxID=2527975 RepID=A0A518B0A9_9BACT|nr:Periplasmic binding protein [Planctomycetes bacterium Pan216]